MPGCFLLHGRSQGWSAVRTGTSGTRCHCQRQSEWPLLPAPLSKTVAIGLTDEDLAGDIWQMKGKSWPLGSSGAPRGLKSDTGPLPARVSSQRLWARNSQSQDPTKEPKGGGRRPVSETRSFMSPTGPRISTVSRGECELRAQSWVDREGLGLLIKSPTGICRLRVGGTGGAFEQQVAGAVLDLMGDEAQNLSRGRQQLRW